MPPATKQKTVYKKMYVSSNSNAGSPWAQCKQHAPQFVSGSSGYFCLSVNAQWELDHEMS